MRRLITVLIAGIGGGSLGTEIAKSLRLAGNYRIVGCDASPLAFGHYGQICDQTHLVSRDHYIDDILKLARTEAVECIVPGAEEPMRLLAEADKKLADAGIRLAMNTANVVVRLANKEQCFLELQRLGVRIPRTVALAGTNDFRGIPLPCIVKPAIESGGSSFAFFARDEQEARLYAGYLNNNGKRPIAQEYITHEFGEFTVGVLSDPNANVLGTIAMKRAFPAKLSISAKGEDFLVSSGISQGHIGDYRSVCEAARAISVAVGSKGPLNIQGRVDRDGHFLPFEINPRFSASTYLRALAGFNEIDHFIRLLVGESGLAPLKIEPGWYLRGLAEVVVPEGQLIS